MHLKCISIFNKKKNTNINREEGLSRGNNVGQGTTDFPQHGTVNSGAAPQHQTLAPQLYSGLVDTSFLKEIKDAMRNLQQAQETQGKMLESLMKKQEEESAAKLTSFSSLFD